MIGDKLIEDYNERTRDNWLALYLAITYIEDKQGYYSSDEALRKLKLKN